jgi:Transposase DNA-binding/Transposase Tn5 dimerisation domain
VDSLEAPQTWAKRHFGGVEMGDVRRVARVVTIAEAMAAHPGHSIPQMFEHPYEVKAAYHLFNLEEATPDRLQAGHRSLVWQRLSQAGTYLLLEDTSELAWHNCAPREGLGPLGANSDRYQGLHLHSVLAVQWSALPMSQDSRRPPVEIIGLCDQQYHIRQRRPEGERDDASYARKKRDRESQLWEQATHRIGLKPQDREDGAVRWVRVCDRGADIYEHLHACQKQGYGFVIRASQDRALVTVDTGQNYGHLFATAQSAPLLGHFAFELRARLQQPARTAHLAVSATRVALRAPQRPGCSAGSKAPIQCSVVRVWERSAPAGVEPLEWVLLCDQEITDFETAHTCVLQYGTRWLIEEFHKALKTGVGVERLQLKTADRLFAAIALLSVVALRLLNLREHLRVTPAQPAEECGLETLELEVLRLQSSRVIHTVQDVALALGRLGGHLNRRGDGMPGWQVLWRGMQQLQTLVEGVRLASRLK